VTLQIDDHNRVRTLTLLLVPFAPFLAAELWKDLGETSDVFQQPWPVANAELARESQIEIPVQVNGKLANVIKLAADADEAAIMAASLADEKVAARIAGFKPGTSPPPVRIPITPFFTLMLAMSHGSP